MLEIVFWGGNFLDYIERVEGVDGISIEESTLMLSGIA